jgi:hypothetical protein
MVQYCLCGDATSPGGEVTATIPLLPGRYGTGEAIMRLTVQKPSLLRRL